MKGHAELARIFRCFLLSYVFPASFAAGAGSSVQGAVVDDAARPVVGAHIFISRVLTDAPRSSASGPTLGAPIAMTVSDTRGDFAVDGLPPGSYAACVTSNAPGLLDPCQWSATPPVFTVDSGPTPQSVSLTMVRGAVVHVFIDDPQGLLPAISPSGIDANLQVHIVTEKGQHSIVPASHTSPAGRDFVATIPIGSPAVLQIRSPRLIIHDQSGNVLYGQGTVVHGGAEASPETLTYTVAGKK